MIMITLRRVVIRRMKRLANRVNFCVQISIVILILTYLFYCLTNLLFQSNHSRTHSQSDLVSPQVIAPKSLFLIHKRGFGHLPSTKSPSPVPKCAVTVAIILCEDDRYLAVKNKTRKSQISDSARNDSFVQTHAPDKPDVAKDFSRQINQTLVLLKSIAILTKFEPFPINTSGSFRSPGPGCVEVLILSDNVKHYENIKNELETKWSLEFREVFHVTHVPVHYPPGSSWMKKMFRPCATLRLFLAELLLKWDSVIYLDTDVIFFESVQTLWSHFNKFENKINTDNGNTTQKLAALAPCLFHYGSSANSVPYFGTSGLNAGVMLMNLTRMRVTQWTNKIRMVTSMFQDKIKLADQDILNIYFHFFPEELELLGCKWNFRPFQCRTGSYCEDADLSEGISVLHGNALSFTPQGPEPLFHAVYQTFHKTQLDKKFNLERFMDRLETSLLGAEEKSHSDCKKFGGLNLLMLNRLYKIVEK